MAILGTSLGLKSACVVGNLVKIYSVGLVCDENVLDFILTLYDTSGLILCAGKFIFVEGERVLILKLLLVVVRFEISLSRLLF